MHERLIKLLSGIIKRTERGLSHMLAPRRGCLGYSKVYYDVRKRWLLAWKENRHITYDIFHIENTNSEIRIGHLYIRPRILIPKSVLAIFTSGPTLFGDTDLIIAGL